MGQAPIPQGVTAICAHEGSAWTAGAFSEPDTLLQWTPAGEVAGRTEVASEGVVSALGCPDGRNTGLVKSGGPHILKWDRPLNRQKEAR